MFQQSTFSILAKSLQMQRRKFDIAFQKRSNVRFYGGHRLAILANTISQQQDQHVRERLTALDRQLFLNTQIWQSLLSGVDPDQETQAYDARGPFLHGMEEFLTRPLLPDRIPFDNILVLWQLASISQCVKMRHYQNFIGLVGDLKKADLSLMRGSCQQAIDLANNLRIIIQTSLTEFPTTII